LESLSKELLSNVPPNRKAGKNPFLLAGSAVFMASSLIARDRNIPNVFTKVQFSKDVGIAEYTLRSHLCGVFESPQAHPYAASKLVSTP
jgi:transcription initiation factor TFIIIB Brf1 subunit/transcription initiation factor TFIIB